MTEHEVQSIGVWSLAKILGVMGFVWGFLMVFLSLTVGVLGGMPRPWMMGGGELLVGLVGGPIYGFVTGAVTAILYNAIASIFGGVELDLA